MRCADRNYLQQGTSAVNMRAGIVIQIAPYGWLRMGFLLRLGWKGFGRGRVCCGGRAWNLSKFAPAEYRSTKAFWTKPSMHLT